MDQIKSNPTQLLMFGILAVFASIMVAFIISDSFSEKPIVSESTVTATQTLMFPHPDSTLSPGIEATMTGTMPTTIGISATSSSPGTVGPPTGVALTSSAQQGTTVPGPPSSTPLPATLQSPTQNQPPITGSPPSTRFPVSTGTYDDTDIAWQYYGPDWTTFTGDGPYDDSIHFTGTIGSYAEITFNGTALIFTFTIGPTRGLIDVFIDGTQVDTIDAYDIATSWQSVWFSDDLTEATHTVRFVHAGEGTYIDVDAIDILP